MEGYRVAGSDARGRGFRRRGAGGAGGGQHARVGNTRDRRVRAALEPTPAGAAVRLPAWALRPRQRRRGAACGPRLRCLVRGARPQLRRPVVAQGGAGQHGRDLSRGACARGVDRGAAAGADRAGAHSGAPPAEPLCGPAEGPITLLVGAEREGLPAELVAACERVAYIPIANDSLNAAMAATIALYELTRVSADRDRTDRTAARAGRRRDRRGEHRARRWRRCACATSGARPSCRRRCAGCASCLPRNGAPWARPPTRRVWRSSS